MIKQPFLLVVSGLVLPVLLYFVVDRMIFLASAEKTTGSVTNISGSNSTCGSKRNRYSCTKFKATVQFASARGEQGSFSVAAGSSRGYGQSTSSSSYHIGSTVPVRYNPKKLSEAYRDEFFDIWGTPIMTFIVQIATFFGAFARPRRRRRYY